MDHRVLRREIFVPLRCRGRRGWRKLRIWVNHLVIISYLVVEVIWNSVLCTFLWLILRGIWYVNIYIKHGRRCPIWHLSDCILNLILWKRCDLWSVKANCGKSESESDLQTKCSLIIGGIIVLISTSTLFSGSLTSNDHKNKQDLWVEQILTHFNDCLSIV